MAVVVGRMVAVLEAQTANFDARMSAASQQLNRMEGTSSSAHRGLNLLRGGLQQLSFSAAGVSGPLGKVTAGLLTLSGGGGLLLGVTAAVGLLALAQNALAESTKAAAKAQEDWIHALEKTPSGTALARRIDVQTAQANLDRLLRMQALPGHQDEGFTAIAAARSALATAQIAATAAQRDANDATIKQRHAIDAHALALAEAAVLLRGQLFIGRGEMNRYIIPTTSAFLALSRNKPFTAPAFDTGLTQPPLGRLSGFDDIARGRGRFPWDAQQPQAREYFISDLEKAFKKVPPAKFQFTPEFGQMLLFSVMQAQQGNALGGVGTGITALAGMKGIGAAAGPLGWIGFGISALSTLFGSKMDDAARQRERHHQELIGALHEGPARISQYFEGDPEASLYQHRRLERLGGEPRNGGL